MFGLKEQIRLFRLNWSSKTPKEKWLFLYNLPKVMFEIVGVKVFTTNEVNWYSQLGNCLIIYYISMCSYTLYYYHCKHELVYGIRCLCGMGILISVSHFQSLNCRRFYSQKPISFAHLPQIPVFIVSVFPVFTLHRASQYTGNPSARSAF